MEIRHPSFIHAACISHGTHEQGCGCLSNRQLGGSDVLPAARLGLMPLTPGPLVDGKRNDADVSRYLGWHNTE